MTIRDYVKKNFKDAGENDITSSIEMSLKNKEEETLPGLGVLFETLWENSSKEDQMKMSNIIAKNI